MSENNGFNNVDYKSGYSNCKQIVTDAMTSKGFSRMSAVGEAIDIYNEQSEAWGLHARFGFLDSVVNTIRREEDDIDWEICDQEAINGGEKDE